MKRKVALLTVLLPVAPLLILDEPTNTLDPTMRDELFVQLKKARDRGQAVLFSSHILTEVEQVADRVAILRQGKLVHLEALATMRQGSRFHLRFENEAPLPPEGLGAKVHERWNHTLVLEHTGSLPALFEWLGRQRVVDVRLEPLGLAAVYRRYHGNQP
jgi:ABC-2 type transport system ATP-binding protein